MFESVELSLCNDTCKSVQLLFKYLQHQTSAQKMTETGPEDLSTICPKLFYIDRLDGNCSVQSVSQLLRADVVQIVGRCFGLQIGDPWFANRRPILDNKPCFQMLESVELSVCNDTCKSLQLLLQIFATPKLCPTSARNLPWRLCQQSA